MKPELKKPVTAEEWLDANIHFLNLLSEEKRGPREGRSAENAEEIGDLREQIITKRFGHMIPLVQEIAGTIDDECRLLCYEDKLQLLKKFLTSFRALERMCERE